MVASIHQAGRIGVVPSPGKLRKVERRNQPRKDFREEGDAESPTAEEESRVDDPDIDQEAVTDRRQISTLSDDTNNKRTGRRIDVRI